MTELHPLVVLLTVIVNYIELSSGGSPKTRDFLTNFGMSSKNANQPEPCSLNSVPIPPVSPDADSNSPELPQSSKRSRTRSKSDSSPPRQPSTRRSSLNKTPPPKPSPARCIVPPARLPSADGRGYAIEYLERIRITSHQNRRRIFQLRRYTFPVEEKIKLRIGINAYAHVTDQEQIVLSTSNDDVFAILESSYVLAGIYVYYEKGYRRTKINMKSGRVALLKTEEVKQIPVGPQRKFLSNYDVKLADV